MPAPFYNAIRGTTSGTPGTGAFTPSAAASGYRAWSIVPSGWIGMVRFEDGSSWELTWSYWNGTTLSRSSTQLFDSSSGSAISLTSSATAAMIAQASDMMSHVGTTKWSVWLASTASALTALGAAAVTVFGTNSAPGLATTNYLTEQLRVQYASATTANAQGGPTTPALAIVDTSAGHGGFEFVCRFGASQLPTGPRLFVGMTSTTFAGNTGEPSALTANLACFAKDSTDTNIQLLVNSNAGGGTKTDTGIPLTANGWYEASVWIEPGSNKVYGLLIRLDTGDIWYGSTTTDVPANGASMLCNALGGLSSTTGTAFQMCVGSMSLRAGQ